MKKLFIAVLFLLPTVLFAQSGADDAINSAAQAVLDILTGTLARTASVIAVVVLGYFGLSGRINGRLAFNIILGIAIINGAASIVDLFS